MDPERHKRMYALHEWIGLLFGLFLFMVAFTGTVAMFHDELSFWESVELRDAAASAQRTDPDALVAGYVESLPEGSTINSLFLALPSAYVGYYSLFANISRSPTETDPEPRAERQEVRWHAETGAEIVSMGDGPAHWLRDIHRDLMLPNRTVGRFLVGIAGLVMLVSILTGVLTHRKLLRELFTLRAGRSRRLQWKDTHNVLGVWALPFHAMIAFSGAYLGLVVILLPIFAFIAFKGDQDAAIAAVIGAPQGAAGVEVEHFPIGESLARAHRATGYPPTGVRIDHYGDAHGQYEVFLHPVDQLQISRSVRIDGVTGRGADGPVSVRGGFETTRAEVVLNAMTALHYATFGGAWLKILYVGLGLALCVMIATGNMVWVERRANGPIGGWSRVAYMRIGRFGNGFMMGLPLATVAVLYADRMIDTGADARLELAGWTYMGCWCISAMAACLTSSGQKFFRASLTLFGVLAMGVLPLDALTIGDASLLAPAQRTALAFDLGIALIGLLAALVGLRFDSLAAGARRPRRARSGGGIDVAAPAAPME